MKRKQIPLEHFDRIQVKKPSDVIIEQFRDLIKAGVLNPGDMLPSERSLAERLKISRGYVREAIRKLEYYGIFVTLPQKGTFVSSLGVKPLEGLIGNVLHLDRDDFASLMETRAILEIQTTRLAAVRRSDGDVAVLTAILSDFQSRIESGADGIEKDIQFHLKISEISGNPVLMSLMSLIIPDIIRSSWEKQSMSRSRSLQTLREHMAVLNAIQEGNPAGAVRTMTVHMNMILDADLHRKNSCRGGGHETVNADSLSHCGEGAAHLSHPLPM